MARRVFERAASKSTVGMSIACCLALAGSAAVLSSTVAASVPVHAGVAETGPRLRLRWLTALGAESTAVPGHTTDSETSAIAAAPGAAWGFRLGPDGSLLIHRSVAVDPSAVYGVAAAGDSVIVAGRDGHLSVWRRLAGDRSEDLAWRQDLGERITAVAWDGTERVLAASWANRLQAFAASDGRRLWAADIGGRAEAPPLAADGAVFVATKAKMLVRLDASTGAVRWRTALPGSVFHPLVLAPAPDRLLACITSDGQLTAVFPDSGRILWSQRLPARAASRPEAFSGSVLAVTADGALHCYSSDGVLRWATADAAAGPADLLVQTNGTARILIVSKKLAVIDAEDGQRVAEYPKDAVEELRRRFAMAMIDGEKTYSEAEKQAVIEREAFDIQGSPFGPTWTTSRHVAFGTSENWIFLFDGDRLRPVWRYHAGQSASGIVASTESSVLAAAGDEVFALDPTTGGLRWRRNVGSAPLAFSALGAVGVLGEDRFTVLDPNEGTPRFTERERLASASPARIDSTDSASGWLLATRDGVVRVVAADGRPWGVPLSFRSGLLSTAETGNRTWVAATSDGRLVGVVSDLESGRLSTSWETSVGEPLSEAWLDAKSALVRLGSGPLISVDPLSGQEKWRIDVGPDEQIHLPPGSGLCVVLSASTLRAHDIESGERLATFTLTAPVVAVTRSGGVVLFLDRFGRGYRGDLGQGRLDGPYDVTPVLQSGLAVPKGFVVTTVTGEVGSVEVAEGDETFSQ